MFNSAPGRISNTVPVEMREGGDYVAIRIADCSEWYIDDGMMRENV